MCVCVCVCVCVRVCVCIQDNTIIPKFLKIEIIFFRITAGYNVLLTKGKEDIFEDHGIESVENKINNLKI